jgi:xylan 1,4-beta-xylosidase
MKPTERFGHIIFIILLFIAVACNQQQGTKDIKSQQKSSTQLSNDATVPRADLGNGYFRNPVLVGTRADNSIVRVNKDFYMIAGGRSVWHSRDMVNWLPLPPALNTFRGGTWASDIVFHKGKYYIYTTEVSMARGNVGPLNMAQRSLLGVPFKDQGDKAWSNVVVWADDPAGPWSEPIELGVYGVFDPGHIVDKDGNRYLFFNKGMMIKLAPDGLSVEGDLKVVYEGWDIPEDWVMECHCLEAPKLIRFNDYYYMASAQGGTGGPSTAHMGVIARAKSLEGPWENSPYNPIVRTWDQNEKWVRQGHGTLIDDIEGNWWFMYTGYEKGYETLGKQPLLLPVEWTEDGWPVIKKGITVYDDIKKPAGEDIGHGIPVSDDFTSEKPGRQWSAPGGVDPEKEFEFGKGYLKIPAKGKIPGDAAIQPEGASLLSVNQYHHAYEVQVEVEIPDTAEGGLMITGGTTGGRNTFATAGIRKGKLFATWGGVANYLDWNGNKIFVKIRNRNGDISCFYSNNGENWKMFTNSTSVTNASTISLYAAGEGDVIFKNFKFHGLE